jgi:protein SCO1/2
MKTEQSTPGTAAREGPRGLWVAVAVMVVAVVGALGIVNLFDFGPARTVGESKTTGEATIGGPFALVDQDGKAVTDADFRGRYMLIYFGFTACPDICPTALARNGDALDMVGAKAEKVVPILISVDPERDTPRALKDYIGFFHPRLVGLTGSPEQVAAAAKAYRVYYAKTTAGAPEGGYFMDHSGFTYLMGPDGTFIQFFRHDLSADEMAARLGPLL